MAYNPTKSTDHSDRAVLKYLEQFRNKPILDAMLRSFTNQIQKIEDAAWEVILYRSIANGFGKILDMIGDIVGRGRANLSDDDYKIALRAQIRINRSCGLPEDIIAVARLSLPAVGGGPFPFSYSEFYPAGITVQLKAQVTFSVMVLFANLVSAKDAGVRLLLEYSTVDPATVFQFADFNVEQVDATQGFMDQASGLYGGTFQTVTASEGFSP